MNVRLSADFVTGLLFCGLGGGAIYFGAQFPIGAAARMGPGYFPLMISCGLIVLGLTLIGRSFATGSEEVGEVALRPLLILTGSALLFGLLIEGYGFPLAGILLVIGACLAGRNVKLFVYLLGLNLPGTHAW